MNKKLHLITACVAALAFSGSIVAAPASSKSPSPSPSASPAASAAASPAAKAARAVPFRGNASAIDQSAKTFTIAGKSTSRVIKMTDATTITKGDASATFADITDGQYVTGSYMKKEDGSMEAKSVKIGGKSGTDTGASKKAKKDDSADAAAASPSPSASPKKK